MTAASDPDTEAFRRWEQHAARLFQRVAVNFHARRAAWENQHGEIDDETAAFLCERPIVCVEHLRFIPCRRCLYNAPATLPYSDAVDDVNAVRRQHADTRTNTDADTDADADTSGT